MLKDRNHYQMLDALKYVYCAKAIAKNTEDGAIYQNLFILKISKKSHASPSCI